jgi:hypothetical protein
MLLINFFLVKVQTKQQQQASRLGISKIDWNVIRNNLSTCALYIISYIDALL